MTKDDIKKFLIKRPGYLKEGAQRLADKLECNVEDCRKALKESRIEFMGGFTLSNISTHICLLYTSPSPRD